MSRSGIARSYDSSVFSVLMKAPFLAAMPVYIAMRSVGGFPSHYVLPVLIVYRLLDDRHAGQCEIALHCDLICISLTIIDAELHVLSSPLYVFFGEMSV